MPLYSYIVYNEDGSEAGIIELMQGVNDPPLTKHPTTGDRLERCIGKPSIAGRWTDRAASKTLSDNKRLGELGFTKYEKKGDGYYERTAGSQGPKTLNRD